MIGIEKKYFDVAHDMNVPYFTHQLSDAYEPPGLSISSFIPTSVTDTQFFINGPARGSAATERLGKSLTMKSLLINGCVRFPCMSVAVRGVPWVFLAVVLDKECRGSIATPSSIYKGEPYGSDAYLTDAQVPFTYLPHRNLDDPRRYKVLRSMILKPQPDLSTRVTPTAGTSTTLADANAIYPSQVVPFEVKVPVNGIQVNFSNESTALAATSQMDNAIFIMAWWSSGQNTDPVSTSYLQNFTTGQTVTDCKMSTEVRLSYYSRMRFYSS